MFARIVFALILTAGLTPAAPVPKVALTAEQEAEFNRLWDAAYRKYGARAQLYCRLVQQPDAAVAYLTRTVKPAKLDEKEAKALIATLGSKDETTWKRAYRDLVARDVRLAMSANDAWAEAKTDEQQLRLGYLLFGFAMPEDTTGAKFLHLGPDDPVPGQKAPRVKKGWELWWLYDGKPYSYITLPQDFDGCVAARKELRREIDPRVVVATAALERIGSRTARDHLGELARGGHAKSDTAVAAAAALDRATARDPDAIPMAELWVLPFFKFPEVATVNQFLARPGDTVKFCKEKLRPVKLTPDGAKKLLAKLFSDDLDQVRAALREFDQTDLRLVMTVEDAWKEAKTAAHRVRLVTAMKVWSDQPQRTVRDDFDPDAVYPLYDFSYTKWKDRSGERWSADMKWRDDIPEAQRPKGRSPGGGYGIGNTVEQIARDRWYREDTAIAILDAIGTDEALAIIKDMATGHPDAGPTKAAAEVLKRRKK